MIVLIFSQSFFTDSYNDTHSAYLSANLFNRSPAIAKADRVLAS